MFDDRASRSTVNEGSKALDRYAAIPNELKQRDQWVLFRLEINNGKESKVPYARKGNRASVTNPSTWSTFSDVLVVMKRGGYDGLGFVFTRDDPYTGIDLDKCADRQSGLIESLHPKGMT